MRTEQLRREFDLTVRHTVFPLHPETSPEGVELSELFAARGKDLGTIRRRLQSVADEVGVPLGERSRTYNSRRAQELGKWAEEQGRGDAFRAAAYHAYFVSGSNIHLPETLSSISSKAGLDPEGALQVVREGRYSEAVDADWQRALDLGIRAVPTLLYEGRTLVGFTPYENMRQLILG